MRVNFWCGLTKFVLFQHWPKRRDVTWSTLAIHTDWHLLSHLYCKQYIEANVIIQQNNSNLIKHLENMTLFQRLLFYMWHLSDTQSLKIGSIWMVLMLSIQHLRIFVKYCSSALIWNMILRCQSFNTVFVSSYFDLATCLSVYNLNFYIHHTFIISTIY